MQKKLQELTDKIYKEGINKSREEGDKLIAEATKQSEQILSEAKKKADGLIARAEKESEEMKKNSLNELQLAAKQLISDLKQQIVDLIQVKAVKPETQGSFKDVAFTQDIIRSLVSNWDPQSGENVELSVLLPLEKQKEFDAFFKDKSKDLLKKGIDISYTESLKGGFKIGPKDGGFMISFSDEDFENLFKTYMRPKLISMLFDEK
jgi:V/A-type H+/Na+-transporting ATPase subunit E